MLREGDILGAAQHGRRTQLEFLHILEDEDVIEQAREDAFALVADGKHLLTDVVTSVGVVVGLVAAYVTGIAALDPILAAVVALNAVNTFDNADGAASGLAFLPRLPKRFQTLS